ncbi:unnamed protein product, partial [Mesorhabditis spiculigera]
MSTRSVPLTVTMLTECALVVIVTAPLAIAILAKRAYKERKDHVTILFLIAADIFYALSFGYMNVERYIFRPPGYNSSGHSQVPASDCNFHPTCIFMFLSVQVLGSINLSVAVDRLIATVWPTKYYQLGPRASVILMSVPFLVAIFFYVLNCILNYTSEEVISATCPYYSFPHPVLDPFFTYHRLVSTAATIPIYMVIGFLLWRRTVRHRNLNGRQQSNHLAIHLTLAMTTLAAVIFMMVPDIITAAIPRRTLGGDFRLILSCVVLGKAFANFAIYIWRFRELRTLYIQLFTKSFQVRRKTVIDMSSNNLTPIK